MLEGESTQRHTFTWGIVSEPCPRTTGAIIMQMRADASMIQPSGDGRSEGEMAAE